MSGSDLMGTLKTIRERLSASPELNPYTTASGGVVVLNGPFPMDKAKSAQVFIENSLNDMRYLLGAVDALLAAGHVPQTANEIGPQEPPSNTMIFNRKQPDGTYRPASEFFDKGIEIAERAPKPKDVKLTKYRRDILSRLSNGAIIIYDSRMADRKTLQLADNISANTLVPMRQAGWIEKVPNAERRGTWDITSEGRAVLSATNGGK